MNRLIFRSAASLILAAFLGIFLLWPIYIVIEQGLRWELLFEVFQNPIYRQGLLNSLSIALVATALSLLIALPLALLIDAYDFPGKNLTNILVLVPMILPPFVGALGFQQLLGHYGIINTLLSGWGLPTCDFLGGSGKFWSVCVIEALHLYPILYLNLLSSLGNLDPAMNDAAANLGAGPWTRLRRITLPLMKPGLLAGISIVLIWSFTELGTPLMFGYERTTAVQLYNSINELENNPLPYTLVAVMLAFSAMLYLASRLVLRNRADAAIVKGMSGSRSSRATAGQAAFALGAFMLVTLLAALPHLALIFSAFSRRWYGTLLPEGFTLVNFQSALGSEYVVPSIMNSLKYSSLATVLAILCGTLVAVAHRRWRSFGSGALDLISMLPLAVPGIVVAFGYLGLCNRYEWAQALFDPLGNPLLLLGTAYAIRRLPYVVRSVSSGLEQMPEDFENAALNLGASRSRVLFRIVLPLLAANLAVGGLFAFSFSMLEVSDSLILAQKQAFYPITKEIYELSQILGEGPAIACAFGVWAMFFLASALAAAGILLGKRLGSIFRF